MADPNQPFRIRRLTPADFRALLRYDWDPLVKERDTIYLFLTQDHPSMCFVAEEAEGKPVGYVVAARSADGKAAFIFHLHVRRDRRGRGIGRALMEHFEAGAREAGVGCIWLLAGERARGFYARIGYSESRDLLHPDAVKHMRSVKNASVLFKRIGPPDGPNAGVAAKKRRKGG